jgi:glucosamine-6-phosphate deaminase
MQLRLIQDPAAVANRVAAHGAEVLRSALARHDRATLVAATGMSQLGMLGQLATLRDVEWRRVTVFHLDEYIGLPATHRASFRRYLRERFLERLPQAPEFIGIQGDASDLAAEIARLNGLLAGRRVDLCFAGVGDNAHLAFNDPPADFMTDAPYIEVRLDETCRRQQSDQGWFAHVDEVPQRAISMSIRQILCSDCLLLTVTGARKARALRGMVEGPVDPDCPASAVQNHHDCWVYIDAAAAGELSAMPPVAQ